MLNYGNLIPPKLTTSERDAITWTEGSVIYNTTLSKFQGRESASWVSFAAAVGGSSLRNVTATDTFATASETINCTSGTFIINLPTAIGIQGTVYTLVNSGTGTITLKGVLGQTINSSLTVEIKKQHVSRTVQSDGANWIIL